MSARDIVIVKGARNEPGSDFGKTCCCRATFARGIPAVQGGGLHGRHQQSSQRRGAASTGICCRKVRSRRRWPRLPLHPCYFSSNHRSRCAGFSESRRRCARTCTGPLRSGTRSLTLYAIGEVLDRRMNPEDIRPFGERFGFDLTVAEQWIARRGKQRPTVKGFFDPRTSSVQYVVSDLATAKCAIIDPVLDFNERSGGTATGSADDILAYVAEQELTVGWILDTHIHADHFSAAPYLQRKTGAPMAIGDHVRDVQELWATIYNWPSVSSEGPFWDHLFADGERFEIGSLAAQVVFSPGHTLASITYLIGDAAFVHDTLFMPDSGTARTDFPGGNAKQLWKSIQVILALPDETRVFTGHDYQPGA